MTNDERMTKHEAGTAHADRINSSFGFRISFIIRHSGFVIRILVDLMLGKLPETAPISKWKDCCAVVAVPDCER